MLYKFEIFYCSVKFDIYKMKNYHNIINVLKIEELIQANKAICCNMMEILYICYDLRTDRINDTIEMLIVITRESTPILYSRKSAIWFVMCP